MKQCKSCRKEIDDFATKCPYCQGYQQWFRNPQYFGFVFVIPFLGIMIWKMNALESESFEKYRNKIAVEEVRIVQSDDGKKDILTFNVKNDTDLTWKAIMFEVNGYDDHDNLVLANSESEYAWLVQPRSQSYLSATVLRNAQVKKWKMRIVDMKTSKF